jgi:hypothetical protein
MIPNTDDALRMLSQRLMTQLLPDLRSTYSLSDGALIGLLMNAIADETAEGINRRLEDLKEMRQIFDSATSLLNDEQKADIANTVESYRLADVNKLHDAYTRVLIDVHGRCESNENLQTLNNQIWAYLQRHAERHTIRGMP